MTMRKRKIATDVSSASYQTMFSHTFLENVLMANGKAIEATWADVCDDYGFDAAFILRIHPIEIGEPHIHQGVLYVNPLWLEREDNYVALYNAFYAYLK